jgi:hypothetical protein
LTTSVTDSPVTRVLAKRPALADEQRAMVERLVTSGAGVEVVVPGCWPTAAYLAAGHLDHGYAMTVYKAQGMTTGRTFLLGTDTPDGRGGYTGLSRGRVSNDIYIVHSRHPGRPDRAVLAV